MLDLISWVGFWLTHDASVMGVTGKVCHSCLSNGIHDFKTLNNLIKWSLATLCSWHWDIIWFLFQCQPMLVLLGWPSLSYSVFSVHSVLFPYDLSVLPNFGECFMFTQNMRYACITCTAVSHVHTCTAVLSDAVCFILITDHYPSLLWWLSNGS